MKQTFLSDLTDHLWIRPCFRRQCISYGSDPAAGHRTSVTHPPCCWIQDIRYASALLLNAAGPQSLLMHAVILGLNCTKGSCRPESFDSFPFSSAASVSDSSCTYLNLT